MKFLFINHKWVLSELVLNEFDELEVQNTSNEIKQALDLPVSKEHEDRLEYQFLHRKTHGN